ncbi:MAG: hypothetical protein JSS72_12115 [Armatimonadetes bacterium]|nr:hypothetical protein [Armatimonadota bacterium]
MIANKGEWIVLIACLSAVSPSQVAPSFASSTEFITLHAAGPAVALKHGNVMPGSETVTLNGNALTLGTDYTLDAQAGVIYLYKIQRLGDSLSVSYHYTSQPSNAPQSPSVAPGIKLNVMPGALQLNFGFGIADRMDNGSVLTSNLAQLQNNFAAGKTSLTGLFAVINRSPVDSRMGVAPGGKQVAARSTAIAQKLSSGFAGGSTFFEYQKIDKDFSQASALPSDQAAVLTKERGLQRMGMGFDSLHFGSLTVSERFRTVKDDNGMLTWNGLSMAGKGFDLSYKSQKLDSGFARFGDLREQDHQQLEAEKGLDREEFAGNAQTHFGKLSFSSKQIDDHSQKLSVLTYGLEDKGLKFSGGKQEIDKGFSRFGNLYEAEKGQWGREAGLSRLWLNLDAAVGKSGSPIAFHQSSVSNGVTGFHALDASIGGPKLNFTHYLIAADKGFDRLGSLADSEVTLHTKQIATMVGMDSYQIQAPDKQGFLASAGLSRQFDRVNFMAGPEQASISSYSIQGLKDKAELQKIVLTGPKANLKYSREQVGQGFSELTALQGVERQVLGSATGLNRTDLAMDMVAGKNGKLAVNAFDATVNGGNASRRAFSFSDPHLQLQATDRRVDRNAIGIAQIVDPEAGLLDQLRGQDQQQIAGKFTPNKKISLTFNEISQWALDGSAKMQSGQEILAYQVSKNTRLDYTHAQTFQLGNGSLLSQSIDNSFLVTQGFGKAGTLRVGKETQTFDGSQSTGVNFVKDFLGYELPITKTTSVKTERTETMYANGAQEVTTANSVATQLSNRLGVSVTDSTTSGTDATKNATHRNYGAWVDMGNGLKLNWGYARNLAGDQAGTGTTQSTVSLTPGQAGDVKLGGSYSANTWDGQHTQTAGSVSVSTAKPIRLGATSDLAFQYSVDTAADFGAWQRENRNLAIEYKLGLNKFDFLYHGQMDPTSGYRAIDRQFKFATETGGKNPLKANLQYKVRTLPDNTTVILRDFNISAKPAKDVEFSHILQSNPEYARPDLLLGSGIVNTSSSKWKLDIKRNENFTYGGSFEEIRNLDAKTLSRVFGTHLLLNNSTGSPVDLFLGAENSSNVDIRTGVLRYSFKYEQQPGPNQRLSLFISNINYLVSTGQRQTYNNWTAHLDWEAKFDSK